MKSRSGMRKIKFFSLVISILGLLSIGFYYYQNISSNEQSLEEITRSIRVQRTLAQIDNDRQASLKWIVNLISRYNKEMSESEKYRIANEIYLMSKKYPNLNIDFICATITHESAKTWNPQIVSRVGAIGLMQVMPGTGAFLAVEEGIEWTSPEILYDPIINIRLGCRYLSELVKMYEKDGGLAAYNGGPKRAEMWLAANRNNKVLYAETRNYVPAVLELYEKFRSEQRL